MLRNLVFCSILSLATHSAVASADSSPAPDKTRTGKASILICNSGDSQDTVVAEVFYNNSWGSYWYQTLYPGSCGKYQPQDGIFYNVEGNYSVEFVKYETHFSPCINSNAEFGLCLTRPRTTLTKRLFYLGDGQQKTVTYSGGSSIQIG